MPGGDVVARILPVGRQPHLDRGVQLGQEASHGDGVLLAGPVAVGHDHHLGATQRGPVGLVCVAIAHRRASGRDAEGFKAVNVLFSLYDKDRLAVRDSHLDPVEPVQRFALGVAGLPELLVGRAVHDAAVGVVVVDAVPLGVQVGPGQIDRRDDVVVLAAGVAVDEGCLVGDVLDGQRWRLVVVRRALCGQLVTCTGDAATMLLQGDTKPLEARTGNSCGHWAAPVSDTSTLVEDELDSASSVVEFGERPPL